MTKRQPENLIKFLSDKLSDNLRHENIRGIFLKYEKEICFTWLDVEGEKISISKLPTDLRKWIKSEVNKLEKKDRDFIRYTLQRYYHTKDKERMLILESEIDKLEITHFNKFAWYVVREWSLERKR